MGSKKPSIYYNVGSPSYMAPETFALNQYSEKSDVWALGVTLYEMVIGETFDRGRDVMQCIYNIGKEGMAYPKHVSPYCRYVIDQCLCLDPTRRIGLEKLIAILDNKAKICHSISNNIISPTNTSNQQK
jgi:serine/threonine-protein kinase ULK/ATG1